MTDDNGFLEDKVSYIPHYSLLNYWCDDCGANFKANTLKEIHITQNQKINGSDLMFLKDALNIPCPLCGTKKHRHSLFFENGLKGYNVFYATRERIFKIKKKLETDQIFRETFSKNEIYPVTRFEAFIDTVICKENGLNPNIVKLVASYYEFKLINETKKELVGYHLEQRSNKLFFIIQPKSGEPVEVPFDYKIYDNINDKYSGRFGFYDTTFFERQAGHLYAEMAKMAEEKDYLKNNIAPSQYNTYATYHDLTVKALFDEDNKNAIRKVQNKVLSCTYVFEDEEVPEGLSYRLMKFSEFYKEIVDKGYKYLCHYWAPYYAWHIDAYDAFTKEHLDKFLSTAIGKHKDQYDFLFGKK